MILECIDLCKTYQEGSLAVPALNNVNFHMDEGEFVAVMGPSGSGKSTLMNLIGCLDQATSGKLMLDGQDISFCSETELAEIRLRKIGFIFQTFQLLAWQTAKGNVELPLSYAGIPKKERRKIAEQALVRVGLEERMQFLPNQLSGGQKQRVAIARAIVNRPRILLADEPTGALDTASGRQVMELFRDLNKDGVAVLMITHDPQVAAWASRKVIIRDGILTDVEDEEKNEESKK